MAFKFRGREEWSAYLQALSDEDRDGLSTISPGGAATLVGVSRQRILSLIDQPLTSVRAWEFYEGFGRQARYVEVSVLDLLRWALDTGRIQPGQELPYLGRRWEARVLQSDQKAAILKHE